MGSRLGFLTANAWLDNDGRHIWLAHDCTDGRTLTMLPWPTWHSTGRDVRPSVHCEACELHVMATLGIPDTSERCMETWTVDGRWCERMAGHSALHSSGTVDWGEYRREGWFDHEPTEEEFRGTGGNEQGAKP